MEPAAAQFRDLRNEAWKSDHADAMACRDAEELIARAHTLWDAHRQYEASTVRESQNRSAMREQAALLRQAEQAMTAVMRRASLLLAKGYMVDGLPQLAGCLIEVRTLLLQPLADRIARSDGKATPHEVLGYLLRHARFEEGRPVITEDMAAALASPYEDEPAV